MEKHCSCPDQRLPNQNWRVDPNLKELTESLGWFCIQESSDLLLLDFAEPHEGIQTDSLILFHLYSISPTATAGHIVKAHLQLHSADYNAPRQRKALQISTQYGLHCRSTRECFYARALTLPHIVQPAAIASNNKGRKHNQKNLDEPRQHVNSCDVATAAGG